MMVLWNTGKAVLMGSGFCVLKKLLQIRKMRSYGSVFIKNRQNWPKGVHGDSINRYLSTKYW